MDQNFAESKRFRLFCTIVLTVLAGIALYFYSQYAPLL